MKVTDKITITNEDNMELMARYPDNYFDLAIVDPPYGIDIMNGGGYPKKHGFKKWERKSWDKSIPSKEYFIELFRVSKNQIIWGGDYFTDYLKPSQGWIFWFKQKGMTFADGELAWTSFDKATRQYDMSGMGGGNRIHPTQKPIKLYKWILDNYAKEIDCKECNKGRVIDDDFDKSTIPCEYCKGTIKKKPKILDTHLGSASIAIACHDYGFELTACELDKEYYDKAIERIKNHTNQQKLF